MNCVLIIICAAVVLLGVLLLSPLTFTAEYYTDINHAKIKIKYGVISLFGRKKLSAEPRKTSAKPKRSKTSKMPNKSRKNTESAHQEQSVHPKQNAESEQSKNPIDEPLAKVFKFANFSSIKETLETASPFLRKVIKRLNFRVYAVAAAGGENAAKTAVVYGCFCGAVSVIVSVLDHHLKFKRKRIIVLADFSAEKSTVKIKASVSAQTWELLYVGLQGYNKFMRKYKNNNKFQEKQNGGKS